jgi:hypothetical protein
MVSSAVYNRILKEQEEKAKLKRQKKELKNKKIEELSELTKKRKEEQLTLDKKLEIEKNVIKCNEPKSKYPGFEEQEAKELKRAELRKEFIELIEKKKAEKLLDRRLKFIEKNAKTKEMRIKLKERKLLQSKGYKKIKEEKFSFTNEEKEACRQKSLDQLIDEISGSILTCPTGKELEKEINDRELTADLLCFRKRIKKKSAKDIKEQYDKLLEADPERLCKVEKEE